MKDHIWKSLKLVFALTSLSLAPMLAVATSDNGTLTVGYSPVFCEHYGYNSATGTGAYSPGLTGGKNVGILMDVCYAYSYLDVSGFSSDPGSSWLTSITCNGVTKLVGSAGYSYGGGRARWEWTSLFGFQSLYGSNVNCTIVHN